MRHLPSTLFLVSSLGLAVSTAYAQEGQSQTPGQQGQTSIQEVLTEFDEDSSQSLSQEEFEKLYDEKLQAAGTTGAAGQSRSAEQMFGEIDADGDEELSSEELSSNTTLRTQLNQGNSQASTQSAQSQTERSTAAAGGQAGQAQTPGATTERSTAGSEQDSQSSSAAALGAATGAVGAAAAGSQTGPGTANTEQAGQSSQIGAANQASQSSQSSTSQSSTSQSSTRELGQSPSAQSTQERQTSQTTPGSSSQSPATAGATTESQAGTSQLERMAMTQPDEIKGMSVKSSSGEDLGEVSDLVRSRDDGSVYAVIRSGGVLGIGANHAAVKLSELEMEGEELVYPSSKDQLEQMNYQEAQYEPLDESGDQRVSIDQGEQQDVAAND